MNGGFSYKGKTLLSGINPAGKADRIAGAVPVRDRTLYLCPSPLFGYGLEMLLSRLSGFPHAAVLCIEADPELFAIAREHTAVLAGNQQLRLTGCCDAGALCALLRKEWGPRFFRRVETVRLNGGWQLFPALYDTLTETLRREIALDWGNAMTMAKLGRRYIRNAIRNLALIPRCPSLREFSLGGKPVLLLGAGPSLDETLDGLCRRFGETACVPQGRSFAIVCVDTCLPALRDRNITPDLTVILESQHWNLGDFTGLSGWQIPAALDLSALPRSGHILSGGLYLFFTPWTNLSIFGRLDHAGLLPAALPPLGSVGLSAAIIARRLGGGNILCAGLDFSFTLDAFHARSTPGHKARLFRQNRFIGLFNTDAAFGKTALNAIAKDGSRVRSSLSLRNYRDLFEREFGTGVDGNAGRCFDIANTGLPLGITTLSAEAAFDALAGNDKGGLTGGGPATASASTTAELSAFVQEEQARLLLLRNMLSGTSPANPAALAVLVNECNYIWSHFPDYAAADHLFSAEDFTANSDTIIVSFLKRLRAEIDPFLKLWNLTARLNNQT